MTFIPEKEKHKMVRVISCHHFQAQDVFTLEGEPVALCTVDDYLLVATLQHCVEVWDLQNPGKFLHSFPTVDQAKQMVYCRKGQYIGALEVRSSRTAVLSFVRVYLNWQVDMKGQPMRARIAGRVTPSSQSNVGLLEMIELPLQKQAFCIAACQETGNLAVGLGELVSVFRFCAKTHDISRRSFNDLEPLVDIELTLSAHHLALCEDVIACLSPNELHVVKLKIQPDPPQEQENSPTTPTGPSTDKVSPEATIKSHYSSVTALDIFDPDKFVVPDENFVMWSFEDTTSCDITPMTPIGITPPVSDNTLKHKLHPDSWPLVVRLPGLVDPKERRGSNASGSGSMSTSMTQQLTELREVLGPSLTFPVHVKLLGVSDHMVTPVTLLYRHFSLEEEISSGLHSLHLIPVYRASSSRCDSSDTPSNPLISPCSSNLCGLTCFFSSPNQGFLYDLIGCVRLVVTYPYTSAARAVVIEPYLLHAITEAGLETYTLRSIHCALRCIPSSQIDDTVLLPPSAEDPVCLVSLKAFLNIEQMVLSQNRLILMAVSTDESSSSQESDSNGWTVYSITKASPEDYYRDLVEVATSHRKKSPHTYIHLLGEAHCILRGEMLTKELPSTTVVEIHKESCCLLGDFFLMSENSEENRLAVSYYLMSKAAIQDVVSRVLELWAQVHPMPLPVKGLISYLNHYLLEEASLPVKVSQSMADTILDLYADNEPNKLAAVMIKGRLTGYSSGKAVSLLKKRILNKKALPEDMIALSCLCIMNQQTEQVPNLLATLAKDRLIETLVKNHEVWLTNDKQFSTLAQLIRQWRPDIFVEVSLQLVFNDSISANDILGMFQKASPDVPIYKILHFKEFLEALLTVMFAGNKQEIWSSSAPVCLAKIYLARMTEFPKEKSTQPLLRALNLFGTRATWVNSLPPFEGRSLRDPCVNKQLKLSKPIACPCWECNEELLRLQSLMSHELCPQNVGKCVVQFLDENPSVNGALSLLVLSGTPADAVTLLADEYPVALIQYGKDSFGDNVDKWQIVTESILGKLELVNSNTGQMNVAQEALQLLLSHLAEILPPVSLLSLLPNDDPVKYFSYVQRCCQKHQARLLRNQIIKKGLELKAVV